MSLHETFKAAYQERQRGNLAAAEVHCRKILAAQPNHALALNLLGMIAYQAGRPDIAVEMISKAAFFAPDNAEFHFNLGLTLAAAHRVEEAITAYQRCTQLAPDSIQALCNLGAAQYQLGQTTEAIATYNKVIQLQPGYSDAYNNLGIALKSTDAMDAAITCYRRALALRPTDMVAHNNLANALYSQGNVHAAVAACRDGIKVQPDFAQGRWTLALLLLVQENYDTGWPEYEWRLKLRTARHLITTKPRWDGGDLKGQRIFLHSEQGFGDTFQFIRYAPLLTARGATVLLACQSELVSLLTATPGVEKTIARDDALPDFDIHCPLPSLPYLFKTTAADIPTAVPYITPDPSAVQRWRDRLSSDPHFKIGIVWAGRVHPDPKRTMPLATLAPLAQVPNVRLFSLQKGDAVKQIAAAPMEVTDWSGELHDFADTAALIANMDLIVTIDTAVAHLAGAMGHRVWTMLPFAPDWRWLLNRPDSVWYPTMRLFRQPAINDWQTPVAAVTDALKEVMSERH